MRSAGISKAGVLEVTVVQVMTSPNIGSGIKIPNRKVSNFSVTVTVEGAQQSTPVCHRNSNPQWEGVNGENTLGSSICQSSRLGIKIRNRFSKIASFKQSHDDAVNNIDDDRQKNSFLFSVMEFYGLSGIEVYLYKHSITGRQLWATCEVPMHNALISKNRNCQKVKSQKAHESQAKNENHGFKGTKPWFRHKSIFGAKNEAKKSDEIDEIASNGMKLKEKESYPARHDGWYCLNVITNGRIQGSFSPANSFYTYQNSKLPMIRLKLRFIPLRLCMGIDLPVQTVHPSRVAASEKSVHHKTSAIHLAAMNGDVRLLKALFGMLESVYPGGKALNARCEDGFTPLDHLIRGHHIKEIKLMLKWFGKSCMEGFEDGSNTPFHTAALSREPHVLPFLSNFCKSSDRRFERQSGIFSDWDIDYRSSAVVNVNREPLVDFRDKSGMTALNIACKGGDYSTSRILIHTCGANPSLPDLKGMTPLMHASTEGHLKCVSLLLQERVESEAGSSVVPGSMVRKSLLASMKCKPCATDKRNGRTALAMAASKGHFEIVEALVLSGIPFRVRDFSCQTPLHLAAEAGHLKVVKFLVSKMTEKTYSSALKGKAEVFAQSSDALMLEGGPFRVESLDVNGCSALTLAEKNGHHLVAKFLGGVSENGNGKVEREWARKRDAQKGVSSVSESSGSLVFSDLDEYSYPAEEN
mmetsp:Transcript_5589/g.8436  ORF Transcript_5589/g.8436 Transcript_5589/m.8436 type:complete len:696 (-) Transcript_5589:78-2165(-)